MSIVYFCSLHVFNNLSYLQASQTLTVSQVRSSLSVLVMRYRCYMAHFGLTNLIIGENKLSRPVAGGSVLAGVLKSSVLNTTATGK